MVAQEEFDILLGAGGTCMVDQGGPQGGGFGVPVGPMWHHSVSFGDGGSATAAGAPATTGHSYESPGTYEISSDVTCSPCQSVFVTGTATTSVSVKFPHRFRLQAQKGAYNTVGLGSTITRFWLPNDDGFGPPFPNI